jgi:hypothetical protein
LALKDLKLLCDGLSGVSIGSSILYGTRRGMAVVAAAAYGRLLNPTARCSGTCDGSTGCAAGGDSWTGHVGRNGEIKERSMPECEEEDDG